MKNLNLKKNQVVIFVIALMLVTAGYLNYSNQKGMKQDLVPTSALADSEQMASIGDATLVSSNKVSENSDVNDNTSNALNNEHINNKADNSITNSKVNQSAVDNNTNTNINTATNTNNEKNTQIQTTNTSVQQLDNSYFANSRLDRDKMYSQTLENYQKILETDNLNSEDKNLAQAEIKRINQEKNAIMIAENLIKTKGFEDVILFVNNGNVTGIVKAEKLDEQQIAQIQNIITRELGVKVNNINISNK